VSAKESKSANAPPVASPGGGSTRRWLALLVLVAALNFVLGLLVGRGTSPIRFDIQELERQLARLREAELQAEIKRFRIAMEGEGKGSALDFYHELKKDEPLRKPLPGPEAVSKPAAPTPKPPPPAVKPIPPAKTEATAQGGVVLQVAALREADAAKKVESKLRDQGFAVRIVKAQVEGRGTWYRVRVGPFATPEATQEARERLMDLKYKPIVVNP
jgi:cell division septation protein DedD